MSTADRIKNPEEEKRALSEEVKKLRDMNTNEAEKLLITVEQEEIMKYKQILRKAEEELQTKEFMVNEMCKAMYI